MALASQKEPGQNPPGVLPGGWCDPRMVVGTQEFFEEEARNWRRARRWAEIPYVLSGWVQLVFNMVLMGSCFLLFYCFYLYYQLRDIHNFQCIGP